MLSDPLRKRHQTLAAVVALLLSAALAQAGEPTDQLRTEIDRVIKVLEDPELKKENRARERQGEVRKIASGMFDFEETAKRSLARHWASRMPAERDEFLQLFANLLERSYIPKIELYGGEQIAHVRETIDGDQATVKMKITTKQGTEVPVDYRMLRRRERWLVYDLIIEGVSLVANYRVQFNKIITASSYQELVKMMRDKEKEFYRSQAQEQASQR
ncbi:MAG: organic solvent tolerance ABC transporter substrate-binding protein [Candidatus Rokuibacteriota bacterium]|nr:MAG: organic solvent tolerance ABC transporter substrate-binding protein [Candidatus Rokubacteria bacterium]